MNIEKMIDSKLLLMNGKQQTYMNSNRLNSIKSFGKRDGSVSYRFARRDLNRRLLSTIESIGNDDSCDTFQPSTSSDIDALESAARGSESTDSIYYDAAADLSIQQSLATKVKADKSTNQSKHEQQKQILISKSIPIAQKIIDIVHYSLFRNSKCANTTTNLLARLLVGSMIER